ncbi:GntR family transcriptional regulator [Microbacterium sulfonylureivorans]|uniref:GntR family transcriptional regulator n=1 Tax=Microbacterium sulfonylureivorans TaxID=2486854 RepID=UPI000FDCBFFE|nr:GntR family transcriptional regulator [Microbacterium sulfonylureivorans]
MTRDVAAGLHLERGLLSDQIYVQLKGMIKDGQLNPGEQVVESKLARSFRVSQAPVREALKRLAHDGLITHVPHHGNFVTEFSSQEAEQARVARVALEAIGARITCSRLSEDYRRELLDLIRHMRTAADLGNIGDFRESDFQFHRLVIEASGNAHLPRMWDIVEPSLRSMHVLADPTAVADWHAMADAHQQLLDALDGDDVEEAVDLFVCHALGLSLRPERPSLPALDRLIAASAAGTQPTPETGPAQHR